MLMGVCSPRWEGARGLGWARIMPAGCESRDGHWTVTMWGSGCAAGANRAFRNGLYGVVVSTLGVWSGTGTRRTYGNRSNFFSRGPRTRRCGGVQPQPAR